MRMKKPKKFKIRSLGKRREEKDLPVEPEKFVEQTAAKLESESQREPEPEPEPEPELKIEPEREDVEDTISELTLADQSFFCNDFEKAIMLYATALEVCIVKLGDTGLVVGDIHVKIATIHQEKRRPEKAVEHLTQAKDVYLNNITPCEGGGEDTKIVSKENNLELKLVEIITNIANIYVDLSQMEKAHDTYVEALEISREYLPKKDSHISVALNNYANFLSICRGDHEKALETFKETLKLQHENSVGKIDLQTAGTLSSMGKVYMRKSKMSNGVEGRSDAKRAEACFLRVLQLYRLSMIRSGNEKVAEALFNLSEAREWQNQRKGILRNVQFDAPSVMPAETNCDDEYSQYTLETMDDDLEKYSKNASCLFNGPGEDTNESFFSGCFNMNNTFESEYSSDGSSILIDEKDMSERARTRL